MKFIGPGCDLPCADHGTGRLVTLLSNISHTFPYSSQYIVHYDNTTSEESTAAKQMEKDVKTYVAACPKVPIVFAGYSLGGIVTMDTLCNIGSNYTKNVVAAIVSTTRGRI